MIGIPIEVWEENTGITFLRKEFRPDSGGAGEYQGGAGQTIELRNDTGAILDATFFGSRTTLAARGFASGKPGSLRTLSLDNAPVSPKSRINVKPGSVIALQEAGGGGFGDPKRRSVGLVSRDLHLGVISDSYIRTNYPNLKLDGTVSPPPPSSANVAKRKTAP
jgi:N-methylhydantoinase B